MAGNGAALAIAGLAGLGLFAMAASGKGKAPAPSSTTAPSSSANPPQSILDRIVAALSTQDATKIRAEADNLDREGWTLQANDLRRAADVVAIGNAWVMSGDGKARRAPKVPQKYSPLPGILEPVIAEADVDPKRLQAQALVLELERKPRGQEDKKLVRSFQEQNGLKASGNYTPATALCLAVAYGLVPPAPYWPQRGRVKSKENYRGVLLRIAQKDPQRAEEFREAAQHL